MTNEPHLFWLFSSPISAFEQQGGWLSAHFWVTHFAPFVICACLILVGERDADARKFGTTIVQSVLISQIPTPYYTLVFIRSFFLTKCRCVGHDEIVWKCAITWTSVCPTRLANTCARVNGGEIFSKLCRSFQDDQQTISGIYTFNDFSFKNWSSFLHDWLRH